MNDDRWISLTTLGQHRIELDLQIDLFYTRNSGYPRGAPVIRIRSEARTLSTSFLETKPTLLVKIFRFLGDPAHEGCHYIPGRWLRFWIESEPVVLRGLGATEMIRRGGLGELTADENERFIDQLLAIQKNRAEVWSGVFGDYIERQRTANRITDSQWREYGNQQLGFYVRTRGEIRQGDPLPIEVVQVARRGNSEVSPFDANQSRLRISFSQGIPHPWNLDFADGAVHWMPTRGPSEFATRYIARFPDAQLGRHTMHAEVFEYNLTWTPRPLEMEIPTEYDLGEVAFTIVPRSSDTLTPVYDPTIRQQIRQSIAISHLLRWQNGMLSFSIQVHHPPADLAFRVSVHAGGRLYEAGELVVKRDSDLQNQDRNFSIRDAKQMPRKGLIFKFKADPEIARRSADLKRYWAEDITIGDVSIGNDQYVK